LRPAHSFLSHFNSRTSDGNVRFKQSLRYGVGATSIAPNREAKASPTHSSHFNSITSNKTEVSLFYEIDALKIKVHKDLVASVVDAVFERIRSLDGEKLMVRNDFVDHLGS